MNLDTNGLPVQADGDALDQLNRVGILALSDGHWKLQMQMLEVDPPGVMVRHIGANPNNVSGDQLVPAFACTMVKRDGYFRDMVGQLLKRFGFAQNTHDTDGSRKLVPDFLLHRVIMFIARVYAPRLAPLADVVLFINTLVTVIDLRLRNDPDHVDPFVNAVATLYSCNVYRPTYLSKLSARMLERWSIKTLGDNDSYAPYAMNPISSNVIGGLRWYHRAASGGNPEIGEVQVEQWNATLKIARS